MSFARQGSFDEEREVSERTGDVPVSAGSVPDDTQSVVSTPWIDVDAAPSEGGAAAFDPTNTFDTEYDEALPLEQFPITGFIATLGDDANSDSE